MALDAAMISITASELNEAISSARVEKIYMPSRDEAVFTLRTQQGRQSLFMSSRSGSARVHLTEEAFEFPATPPAFCMLLRKYLLGARITSVETVKDDRVILIHFDSLNEMGDRTAPFISVEMMGRYSNIVLVNGEGTVLDAIKRIDESQSDKRQLEPGVEFTYPPVPGKLPFLSAPAEDIVSALRQRAKTVPSALLDIVTGLSPLLCREVSLGLEDVQGDMLDPMQASVLTGRLQALKDAVADPAQRHLNIVYQGDKAVEFSFVPIRQYGELRTAVFRTSSALYDAWYTARDRAERMKVRSMDLTRQIKQLIDRNLRKQQARREELAATGKADEKKLCGELLTANLHSIKKGDRTAEVFNYYDGTMKVIPLDVTRTPNENAQKYYKEYRKLRTASDMLVKLLEEGEQEMRYLETVRYEISAARTEEEFLDIRQELRSAGYLRGTRMKERPKRKSDPFLHYVSSAGLEIIAGRNNAANERLSLRMAMPKDIWCHVKDAAGSHVLLRTEGREPDDASLTEACELAALNSEVADGVLVPVDYTQAGKVRKLSGGRTGMVTYTDQKTAYVTVDKEKLASLKKK